MASLIGLPPDLSYTLAVPSEHSLAIRPVPMPVRKMEETALLFNPEVREQSYQTRISADEARKQLLQLPEHLLEHLLVLLLQWLELARLARLHLLELLLQPFEQLLHLLVEQLL